jgi:alanyl-tRNA synthetase
LFSTVHPSTPKAVGKVATPAKSWAKRAARAFSTPKKREDLGSLAEIEGDLKEGETVSAIVDVTRRRAIERAHSSTHLLHAALRQHLGKHVEQRGSLVEGDRLRFDFVHFAPVSSEELERVEKTVNAEILASQPVEIAEKTLC